MKQPFEQKEKAKASKNAEDLMAFLGQEGIELPDEALDAISGGAVNGNSGLQIPCPLCNGMIPIDIVLYYRYGQKRFMCPTCGLMVDLDSRKSEYAQKILEKVDGVMG